MLLCNINHRKKKLQWNVDLGCQNQSVQQPGLLSRNGNSCQAYFTSSGKENDFQKLSAIPLQHNCLKMTVSVVIPSFVIQNSPPTDLWHR